MTFTSKRHYAAALATVALAGVGAGSATACDHGGKGGVAAAQHSLTGHHGHGLLGVASSYLGLTRDQLKAKLEAGQTLAQIANATPGKSAAGLVDALQNAVKAKLDRLVAAGKLSPEREAAVLAKTHDWFTRVVNKSWTHH